MASKPRSAIYAAGLCVFRRLADTWCPLTIRMKRDFLVDESLDARVGENGSQREDPVGVIANELTTIRNEFMPEVWSKQDCAELPDLPGHPPP